MKRRLSATVLSCALLGAPPVLALARALPAAAQDAPMRILTVTGHGSETVQTTRARVELGVEVQGRTADAVQQDVAQRSSAVVALLRDRAVEQLQTTGIRLSPRYDYSDGQARLVGYVGSNTVSFEVPTEAAGDLLDDAVAAGATEIQNIQFIAADEAIASARDVALRAATNDAQAQAQTVLQTLNLGMEEIVGIQINGARGAISIPLPQRAALEGATADVSTPVIGGEQTVQATVTLQIRY